MYRFVFFLVVLIATCSLYGQGKKTKRLKEWISNHPGEKIPVRIEFIDYVDCFLLNQQFKSNKTPIAERIKTVNRKLITQSIKSQQPILNFLNNRQKAGSMIKPFWIVNIIVLWIWPKSDAIPLFGDPLHRQQRLGNVRHLKC